MNNLPKTAVITIYYNRPNNVKDSINSLINQTYKNLQVVVIDDNSKDNTYEELKKVVGGSHVTLLQNQVNKGFTKTLVDVINDLDVEYVAIHGAGDISLPTRIEEQVGYLEANPQIGVVTTNLTNRNTKGLSHKEITLDDLIKKNRITHGAVMFRLSAYHKAGGYRTFFTSRQDKDLWYRMSLVTKLALYDKPLYTLVSINNSVSATASKTSIPTMLSSFATYLIQERLIDGTDSLDRIGDKSALFFNPVACNSLYYNNIKRNLYKRKYDAVIDYTNILIKTNTNIFHVFALKIFRRIIKIIKK